ncbi:MAG: P-loop NTPase [Nitrososphaerales archaeon]|nr:P-loop NTPase [Nitrososphaerales archaeon]
MVDQADVLKALARVTDPELGRDIVSLHMVEGVSVAGGTVSFTLNLTTPACPLRSKIEQGARDEVSKLPGVKEVAMKTTSNVFATRDYGQAELLKGVKNIIAVASGKGGVGKSTVAVNLAVVLAASGAKVGILDADVYGPNVPHMMGVAAEAQVSGGKIAPATAFGVKIASLGFFYKDETPLIWRGPLVAGAIRQLLTQVDWGELDYLVVDLPPGCLPAGTLVLTANNAPKPIERIKVGDFVLSYDGKGLVPRRVLGVIPQGKQNVFKVRTPNRTIVASGNHPFLKYHPRGNHYWRRLDQLKVGDRILVTNCIEGGMPLSLPSVQHDSKHVAIPQTTTNEFMRIVGHFVGDGFIKKVKGRKRPAELRICEPKGSKFHEEYDSLYKKVFGVKTFRDNDGAKLAISSAPLAELFIALDLAHSARKKDVPDWVFSLPLEQRLSFIMGYAEADGHIRHREEQKTLPGASGMSRLVTIVQDTVAVASTNANLVRRLHELCLMSGIRANNVKSRMREGNHLKSGRLIGPSTQFEFDFSLKPDRTAFKIARITGIEPAGEMDTYDLQVDKYQNFVADSIIVHNTGDASLTLAQTVPLGGVVIVTTPQEAALSIAAKSLAMFRRLDVPILGVVENMSYFVCPHCGEKTHIFSSGGGRRIAAQLGVDFLGEIPLDSAVREQSDLGEPVVAAKPDSPQAAVFKEFGFRVAGMVSIVAFAKMRK